jgi:hypothetical protein
MSAGEPLLTRFTDATEKDLARVSYFWINWR